MTNKRYRKFDILAKFFLVVWILSIVTFFVAVFVAPDNYDQLNNAYWGEAFGVILLTGVASFVLAIIFALFGKPHNKEETTKPEKAKRPRLKELVVGATILLLTLGLGMSLYQNHLISGSKVDNVVPLPVVSIPPAPTDVQVVNTDPIIDCVSSYPSCKGETIRLKSSQCQYITCCGFNNGTWELYATKEKCTQAQNAEATNQQPQQPSNPSGQLNFYCYNNTLKYSYYTTSGEQCNKDNLTSACFANAKSIHYDPCMSTCLSTANENSAICIWAYGAGGQYGDDPELMNQCLAEKDQEHQQCMDACNASYQEAYGKC